MNIIDLRSDTVTQPTEAMREALARAEVGDDVLDEDPTVHRLQTLAAEKMGKAAALLVPSGTMGNLISLLSWCRRGDEILLGDRCHIFLNEAGGAAALGGIQPRTVPNNPDGTLPLELLEDSIRPRDIHYPPTRLICLENTHNYCNGYPLTPSYMASVSGLARKNNLVVHVDGARIFNAAVALGIEARDLAAKADSVMFCLSKGLSAPVGSLVCGSPEFIQRARKFRKMVGGGMRQAGHLAAAGLVALEELVDRLRTDHENARRLARGLAAFDGIHLNPEDIKTNIIFFKLQTPKISAEFFVKNLEARGIKILMLQPGTFRAVLNRGVSQEGVEFTLRVIGDLLSRTA